MKKLSTSRSIKTLSTLLHSEILCPALARLMTLHRPATLCLITLIFSANFSIQAIASDSIQAIASDSIQAVANDSIQAIANDSIDSIQAIISSNEMNGNGSAEVAQPNKSEHPIKAADKAEASKAEAKADFSKAESGTGSEGREVSGKIYFQRNHIDIVPGYMGNDEQFASILERLDSVHPDDILGVKVVGSASPEGLLEFNTYLAIHRAAAIKDYLIKNHSGIFTDSLRWDVTYEYEDWSYVEELLENSDIAHREEALEIIRNTSYDPTGKTPSDRKEKLQQLYGRTVWYEIDRKLHPYSRGAELIATLRDQAEMLEAKSVSKIAESENIEEEKMVFDTKVPTVTIAPERKPMLAVKTNLLLYGLYLPKYGFAPAPNIAVEFLPRQSHWTVGASLDIPWYRNYSNHKFFQIRNWQLEGRRYFKEAGQYWGWYAQAYVHTGVFGIGFNNEEGWEGESGGLGLGGGYVMPISKNKHWKLEFNLQFGYMRSQYDPYVYGHPTDGAEDGLYYYNWTLNPDLFEPRRYKHNWFGPTRVGITISYDLLYYNNKRKQQ